MQNIIVSIIIPTHQRIKTLEQALNSANNQTLKNTEIIVVDDNNNPSYSKQVKEISEKHKAIYIKNYKNKGGCGARNSGILSSQGEYIAFLDDDDLWLPEKLEKQLKLLQTTPTASAVFCEFYNFYEETGLITKASSTEKILHHKSLLEGRCPASTSLVLIKRSHLIKSGLFDESLPSFQDYDMWLKVSQIGPFICSNESLAIFRHHAGERTSINIQKRTAGLNLIIEKWGHQISDLKKFRGLFLSSAFSANAQASLQFFACIKYRVKSIYYLPFNIKNWANLFLSLLGPKAYWALYSAKYSCSKKEHITASCIITQHP